MFGDLIGFYSSLPIMVQYLIVPLVLMLFLWKSKNRCKADWLIKVLGIGLFLLILTLAGSRDNTIGYYTQFVLLVLFFTLSVLSFMKIRTAKFLTRKTLPGWIGHILGVAVIITGMSINIDLLKACSYEGQPISLTFPMKNGTYLFSQGGDGLKSDMINYHFLEPVNRKWRYHVSMRYANDIVKLNAFGFSIDEWVPVGDFLVPPELSSYNIFGETVYSPCEGDVFYVQDIYHDMPPAPVKQYEDFGNGIVIKCNDVYVMMWHLKYDSISVKTGDHVVVGQPIGQVGNSGHASVPHLHIQASKYDWLYGESVPILFDHVYPIKQTIMIR